MSIDETVDVSQWDTVVAHQNSLKLIYILALRAALQKFVYALF